MHARDLKNLENCYIMGCMVHHSSFKIEASWKKILAPELEKPYMLALREFLRAELTAKKVLYPPLPELFTAFNATPFEDVKVVILGQDPYHNPHQAHGLSFSVPDGVAIPPSLNNIFKEIADDLGIEPGISGNLMPWAKQGVLLLNAVLSVEAHKPGSHQNKGWELFTDSVVQALNRDRVNVVFLLWGSYAKAKGSFIDTTKHLVMTSSHPSPLSAYRGFLGCKHFSATNAYLLQHDIKPIDWA